MAASGSSRGKRRKKTDEEELDELTKIVLDLASEPKRPKKESHFDQFHREPLACVARPPSPPSQFPGGPSYAGYEPLTGRRKSYYPYRERRPARQASPPPSSLDKQRSLEEAKKLRGFGENCESSSSILGEANGVTE